MVYPVTNYTFKIGAPVANGDPTFFPISDISSLKPKLKGETKAWTPMELSGWARNTVSGKSLTFEIKGQRNFGDKGNDFVAGKLLATGNDCAAVLQITFPNGDVLTCNGLVDLTTPFGGASTDMDTLEWTYTVDGKPTYVAAASK